MKPRLLRSKRLKNLSAEWSAKSKAQQESLSSSSLQSTGQIGRVRSLLYFQHVKNLIRDTGVFIFLIFFTPLSYERFVFIYFVFHAYLLLL